MEISVTVNGVPHTHDVEPRTLLVQYIREQVALTGTNIGCDTSSCGACTVHLDGESVKSCTILAVQADGSEIKTIEGMATDGVLHPMQQAWLEYDVAQCGYCQPGQIMAAVATVRKAQAAGHEVSDADLDEIRNVCRCGTYSRIREAIKAGAQDM